MNVNINKISTTLFSNCTINTNGNVTNHVTNNNNKQIKIGQYLLGTTIGKGNSAVVKLATHCLTRQKVAIKMFDKSGLDADKQLRLKREIDSMKRLRHENVIRLFEVSFIRFHSLLFSLLIINDASFTFAYRSWKQLSSFV
jgi:serine/threonine protein kinase